MTAISVSTPFPILTDIDGDPLDAGYVYIGQANLDPVAFPKSVYWDASLTTPAAQPIRTSGGYPVRNGSPARIYTDGDYSIRINNKNGTLVYSSPASTDRLDSWQIGYDGGTVQGVLDVVTGPSGAASVGYMPAGTGAVATTVQEELRRTVSILNFGANTVPGATDMSPALIAARTAAAGRKIYIPAGTYKFNQAITSAEDLVIEGDGPATILDFSGTITGGSYALDANGTATQIEELSGTQTIGSLTVTFASAPSLAIGDVFVIYNPADFSWSGFRAQYRAGEWCEVESISGNVVTLRSPLYDTYNAADVDVYKVTGPKVSLKNFSIRGTTVEGLIKATLCAAPVVEGVTANHGNNSVVHFDRCFKPVVINPDFSNVGDGGDDYGVAIGNSQHARVRGGYVYSRRHAVTTGGSDSICCVPCRDIVTSNSILKNDIASGTATADFHGNTEDSSYVDCKIYGGAHLQGKDNFYKNCRITNALSGFVVFHAEVKGGTLGAINCDFATSVNPQTSSRGIYDIGGNTDSVTANTTIDATFIVENCRLSGTNLTNLTSFMLFRNRGASVKTNFRIDGLLANVNNHGNILNTGSVSGVPSADFIIVDRVKGFPAGVYLHASSGAAYDSFPHRLMRQSGKYSTTTTATTSIIAPSQTYKYAYTRPPVPSVAITGSNGVALGSLGGQKPIAWSYQTGVSSIRPIVETTASMTAGVNFDMCWSVAIEEC